MKLMQKVSALALALLMGTSLLTACNNAPETAATTAAQEAEQTALDANATGESAQAADDNAEKALKIAIVSSPSGVDDGNFNQNNYEGILRFIESHPNATVQAIREESGKPEESVRAVENIVADFDVIVACGFQFSGIGVLAENNPNTKFILVDSYPTNKDGETVELENVYAMQFKEQEGGFYAGIAAAMKTNTGKVAVVNGIAFPSNVNYQFGFMNGVKYANEKLGTKAEIVELPSYAGTDVTGKNVGGNYVGTFSDEAKGKVVGKDLLDAGCDVIFVAAGGSGNGVFAAVKEAHKADAPRFVIGCDADQYRDGAIADGNIVLTSALKVMDLNVERQLTAIVEGKFKGQNALLGVDSESTGFVKGEHSALSEDMVKAIEEAQAQIKEGKLDPMPAA